MPPKVDPFESLVQLTAVESAVENESHSQQKSNLTLKLIRIQNKKLEDVYTLLDTLQLQSGSEGLEKVAEILKRIVDAVSNKNLAALPQIYPIKLTDENGIAGVKGNDAIAFSELADKITSIDSSIKTPMLIHKGLPYKSFFPTTTTMSCISLNLGNIPMDQEEDLYLNFEAQLKDSAKELGEAGLELESNIASMVKSLITDPSLSSLTVTNGVASDDLEKLVQISEARLFQLQKEALQLFLWSAVELFKGRDGAYGRPLFIVDLVQNAKTNRVSLSFEPAKLSERLLLFFRTELFTSAVPNCTIRSKLGITSGKSSVRSIKTKEISFLLDKISELVVQRMKEAANEETNLKEDYERRFTGYETKIRPLIDDYHDAKYEFGPLERQTGNGTMLIRLYELQKKWENTLLVKVSGYRVDSAFDANTSGCTDNRWSNLLDTEWKVQDELQNLLESSRITRGKSKFNTICPIKNAKHIVNIQKDEEVVCVRSYLNTQLKIKNPPNIPNLPPKKKVDLKEEKSSSIVSDPFLKEIMSETSGKSTEKYAPKKKDSIAKKEPETQQESKAGATKNLQRALMSKADFIVFMKKNPYLKAEPCPGVYLKELPFQDNARWQATMKVLSLKSNDTVGSSLDRNIQGQVKILNDILTELAEDLRDRTVEAVKEMPFLPPRVRSVLLGALRLVLDGDEEFQDLFQRWKRRSTIAHSSDTILREIVETLQDMANVAASVFNNVLEDHEMSKSKKVFYELLHRDDREKGRSSLEVLGSSAGPASIKKEEQNTTLATRTPATKPKAVKAVPGIPMAPKASSAKKTAKSQPDSLQSSLNLNPNGVVDSGSSAPATPAVPSAAPSTQDRTTLAPKPPSAGQRGGNPSPPLPSSASSPSAPTSTKCAPKSIAKPSSGSSSAKKVAKCPTAPVPQSTVHPPTPPSAPNPVKANPASAPAAPPPRSSKSSLPPPVMKSNLKNKNISVAPPIKASTPYSVPAKPIASDKTQHGSPPSTPSTPVAATAALPPPKSYEQALRLAEETRSGDEDENGLSAGSATTTNSTPSSGTGRRAPTASLQSAPTRTSPNEGLPTAALESPCRKPTLSGRSSAELLTDAARLYPTFDEGKDMFPSSSRGNSTSTSLEQHSLINPSDILQGQHSVSGHGEGYHQYTSSCLFVSARSPHEQRLNEAPLEEDNLSKSSVPTPGPTPQSTSDKYPMLNTPGYQQTCGTPPPQHSHCNENLPERTPAKAASAERARNSETLRLQEKLRALEMEERACGGGSYDLPDPVAKSPETARTSIKTSTAVLSSQARLSDPPQSQPEKGTPMTRRSFLLSQRENKSLSAAGSHKGIYQNSFLLTNSTATLPQVDGGRRQNPGMVPTSASRTPGAARTFISAAVSHTRYVQGDSAKPSVYNVSSSRGVVPDAEVSRSVLLNSTRKETAFEKMLREQQEVNERLGVMGSSRKSMELSLSKRLSPTTRESPRTSSTTTTTAATLSKPTSSPQPPRTERSSQVFARSTAAMKGVGKRRPIDFSSCRSLSDAYNHACRTLGIRPSSGLLRVFPTKPNEFVTRLDLSINYIGLKGLEPIYHVLEENQGHLEYLSLSGNNLENKDLMELLEVLSGPAGSSLMELDLSYNPITQSGGQSIISFINGHPSLKKTHLIGTLIPPKILECIALLIEGRT